MKLRSLLPLILSLFLVVACKNDENKDDSLEIQENYDPNAPTKDEDRSSPNSRSTSEPLKKDSSPDDSRTNDRTLDRASSNASQLSEGRYIKDGETDENCDCYCVDLSFTGTTELCLKEDAIFITARMSRGDEGIVNIFLVEPAGRNTEGGDIPWDDFDRNVPIAVISPSQNGVMEFDWLGFTINGDLAMDYAIYGKKTLEGAYKKK